jgi:hypothetical protein
MKARKGGGVGPLFTSSTCLVCIARQSFASLSKSLHCSREAPLREPLNLQGIPGVACTIPVTYVGVKNKAIIQASEQVVCLREHLPCPSCCPTLKPTHQSLNLKLVSWLCSSCTCNLQRRNVTVRVSSHILSTHLISVLGSSSG